MEKQRLDRSHIGLQFLMMLLSLLSFLVLTCFVGKIVWIKDFQYFVILISSILSVFVGVIALLRYYTQKKSLMFLFLGIGFLAVGLFDVIQLIVDIADFRTLFVYRAGEIYPLTSILSRGFLSILMFLSWLLGSKGTAENVDKKSERKVMLVIVGIFLLFGGVVSYLILSNILVETLWIMIVGIITLMLLILSFIGYMFKKEWIFDNFDFWLIYSISFLLLSQIFFLPLLNLEYYNMVNLSIWAKFFAYVALLVGFLNSIYEMYQNELFIQKELEEKNNLLDDTKKKVEEAYLVIRKEKWDLVGKGKKVVKKVKKK